MCFHEKPMRNDEMKGWFGPPTIEAGDEILFNECGRCKPQVNGSGSVDYHSHHFMIVKNDHAHAYAYALIVRHGGGQERISLGYSHTRIAELIGLLPDSDARYLMIYALYTAHKDAAREAKEAERSRWEQAAAAKRIKTRKERGRDTVKVWIEQGGAR